jgi:hypothetical protein
MGAGFAAVHSTVMGRNSSGQTSGGRGGTQPHTGPATPQVAAPPAAPSPRRARGRGGRLQ